MSQQPPPSLARVTTINEDGSRRTIHPAAVHGRFTTWRGLLAVVLLAVYILLPWIPINGNPAVFIDLAHRQFHFFGLTFVTQDLWLAFFLVSGLAFSLFYLTSLFGRVWCGWVCPQTIFLDISRRIERWIEGDPTNRAKLDRKPDGRRTLKQIVYGLFAAVLAHIFLSYFTSLPQLYRMMTHSPGENWSSFLVVFLMTAALWFNFAWFREQFCIILCPYGRLQGALIDKHTMVLGYDVKRGEPRGKKGTEGAGSCVDCRRCVAVCPTGIDIRQGQQIECIGCAACIDACDDVMDKLKRPRGLIRYDSHEGLAGRRTRWVRPRTLLYTALLCLGMTAMTFALSTLRPATLSLLRIQGAPYIISEGEVRNQFFLRVLNKRNRDEVYHLELVNPPVSLKATGFTEPLAVSALGEQMRPLVVTLPRKDFRADFVLQVRVRDAAGKSVGEKSVTFLGPFTP